MSLDREYESSFIGPTTVIANAVGANVVLIRLAPIATPFKRKSFAIRVTGTARVRQGKSDVANTGASGANPGMHLPTTMRWRVDVSEPKNAYITVIRNAATDSGDVEITKCSDADDYDSGEAPAAV